MLSKEDQWGGLLTDLVRQAEAQDVAAAKVEQELNSQLDVLRERRKSLGSAIRAAQAELERQAAGTTSKLDDLGTSVASRRAASCDVAHNEFLEPATVSTDPLGKVGSQTLRPTAKRLSISAAPKLQEIIAVGRPVGLPNSSNDCFWLAAIQCMRHTPGFARCMSASLPCEQRPSNLHEALATLFRDMHLVEDTRQLHAGSESIRWFRKFAMEALPASDGHRKLVQADPEKQRQQDTHEFLSQLLDYLGGADEGVTSPRCCADRTRLDELERELTSAAKVNASADSGGERQVWARKTAYNLMYEYSTIEWAASATRMRSRAISKIFEGQRLASVSCTQAGGGCGRFSTSGAEPFVIEEVKLAEVDDGSWLNSVSSFVSGAFDFSSSKTERKKISLVEILKQAAECPAPEGYLCPSCKKLGTCMRKARLFRLPSTLIFHVNRAQKDGSRCEMKLDFESVIDLNPLGMVVHFGRALDRNLDPCRTEYKLFGVVFHKGPNARSGHYFAYVLFAETWVRVDDTHVVQPLAREKATPMALEASEPPQGARAVLLFYERKQ